MNWNGKVNVPGSSLRCLLVSPSYENQVNICLIVGVRGGMRASIATGA